MDQITLPPAKEFTSGFRDIAPLAIGVAIYGLAFGLLAAQAGMDEFLTGVMGLTVFAGSSQIIAAERLVSGAGALAAILAGVALNLRILLMTASMRAELAGRPLWQIVLGVHFTGDESWALMHATRAKGHPVGYWYLIGASSCLLAVWITATVSGVNFAHVLPDPVSIGVDFAFTAAFIAILCNLWPGMSALLPWIFSAATAGCLVLLAPIEPSWALALGGLAGAVLAGVKRDA